jgi:hypothetical protein
MEVWERVKREKMVTVLKISLEKRHKIEETVCVRRIDGTITLLYFVLVYVKVYFMNIAVYRRGMGVLKFVYDRPTRFEINNSSSSAYSRISAQACSCLWS